ncbi:MAG: sulfite exporter TauE/SafE family protein [Desulfobacterales bacterium]
MTLYLLYPLAGAVAGVFAGLLGIGGGVIVIPIMVFLFTAQGVVPEHIMPMALGTSLGTIMFTSFSSLRAHQRHGAVHWDIVKRITPGILLGTFSGSWVATRLPALWLKGIFAAFLLYVALQMILNLTPKPTRQLPKPAGVFGVGGFIGIISSLVGIGGGTLSVPFMTWCNLPLHHAIGTSAAIGMPIAVSGAFGYVVNGWSAPNLPAHNLGYINLPALFGIAMASMFTAPLGARLAHRLPLPALKRVFAAFLAVVALRMIWGAF